jgi:hypothetical protein
MRMSIYLTPEYPQIWNCKGSRPVSAPRNAKGILDFSGRIVLFGRLPFKTVIGGMAGEGILRYERDVIQEVLRRGKGILEVYSFERRPVLLEYGFSERKMYTFIIDIADIGALWQKIDKKTRTAVRFAERSSVEFEEVKALEDLRRLYKLFSEQRRRWSFKGPGIDHMENVWRILRRRGEAVFFSARLGGRALSVAEVLLHEDEMMMPQWGTAAEGRKIKANNFLIWKILEWGSGRGFKRFNFWGAEEGPMTVGKRRGIYDFKESFGSKLRLVYKYERSRLLNRNVLIVWKLLSPLGARLER